VAYKDLNKDVEENEQKTSRLNAAGLINSTLENLWNSAYNAMSNGNYILWNVKLDAIWAILGGDIADNDDEDKEFKKINMTLYAYGTLKSKIGSGFSSSPNPNNAIQYQLLLNKSVFLRRLQNKQGKGTAYSNEDDSDFD